eukprot:COSAG05_NODE_580_length_8553_cov_197.460934_5_plen_123_part_00
MYQGGGGGGGYSGGGGGEGGGGGGSYVKVTAEQVQRSHARAAGRPGKVSISWALLQVKDTAFQTPHFFLGFIRAHLHVHVIFDLCEWTVGRVLLLQNGDTAHAEAAGTPLYFKAARFGPAQY